MLRGCKVVVVVELMEMGTPTLIFSFNPLRPRVLGFRADS